MKRNLTTNHHRNKILCLEKQSILDLPEEVIEMIMSYLSFSDLFNLSKVEQRLEHYAKRVMKNKPFSKCTTKSIILSYIMNFKLSMYSFTNLHFLPFSEIAILGGYTEKQLHDFEVISINTNSISHTNSSIPPLPNGLRGCTGTQISNGYLVVCEEEEEDSYDSDSSEEDRPIYLHFKEGSNQWTKVGTMLKEICWYSSVWIDGRLLTIGGEDSSRKRTSHHEEFSFNGGVKEMKEMPIALLGHTATIFAQNKIIVCGGHLRGEFDRRVSNTLFKLSFEK